ncbi:Transposase IS4 [Popillia japonica]|uniref:Transposase IS4 n=1 Tax=Popillia japonica TaxID=7064 RepID=A0AAW1NAC1_POPJA
MISISIPRVRDTDLGDLYKALSHLFMYKDIRHKGVSNYTVDELLTSLEEDDGFPLEGNDIEIAALPLTNACSLTNEDSGGEDAACIENLPGSQLRARAELFGRALDAQDNTENENTEKVRPLFTLIKQKFQDFAPVIEEHSVDESMISYFGRHGCKQFIKGKPIRYVFKMWMGTTSSPKCNGYCVWMKLYQGASTRISNKYKPFGRGPSVVLQRGTKGTEMNKKPRGTYDFKSTYSKISIVKWNDNSLVNVITNCV